MKPKGWKNDPHWVEYYEAKEKEYLQRQAQLMKFRMGAMLDEMRAKAQREVGTMWEGKHDARIRYSSTSA